MRHTAITKLVKSGADLPTNELASAVAPELHKTGKAARVVSLTRRAATSSKR